MSTQTQTRRSANDLRDELDAARNRVYAINSRVQTETDPARAQTLHAEYQKAVAACERIFADLEEAEARERP